MPEFPSDIMEPTEMLSYLQKKIISWRPLEVTNLSQVLEGETNFITVDRHNILETTFEELKHVADPRVTCEVQFYDEQAVDSGGPHKEWMRLCNQRSKTPTLIMASKSRFLVITSILVKWFVLLYF